MNITYKLRKLEGTVCDINPQMCITSDEIFTVPDETSRPPKCRDEEEIAEEQMRRLVQYADDLAPRLLSMQIYDTPAEFTCAFKAALRYSVKWAKLGYNINEVETWIRELAVEFDWNEVINDPAQVSLRWMQKDRQDDDVQPFFSL